MEQQKKTLEKLFLHNVDGLAITLNNLDERKQLMGDTFMIKSIANKCAVLSQIYSAITLIAERGPITADEMEELFTKLSNL